MRFKARFNTHPTLHRRGVRRGSALVEFSLVVGILIGLVMGIIEFGALGKNSLTIANATREGARAAALGRTVEQIQERIKISAQPLNVQNSNITLTYSRAGGSYNPLTNTTTTTGTQNSAAPDDLVRVNVEIQNSSLTGAFGALFNRPIRSSVTMRRESSG